MDTGDSILGFLSNLDLVSDAVEKVLVKQSFWSKDVWLHRCFQCPPKLSTLGDFGTMRFNDTLVALVLAGDLGKVVLEMLRGL